MGLKTLQDEHNKQKIREAALAWIDYLDGKTATAPAKLTKFSLQTQNIPNMGFISNILGTCNSISEAIDSNKKYKPKRNRIAHKAEEFRSESDYKAYLKVIDAAIKQLITKLSIEINKQNQRR